MKVLQTKMNFQVLEFDRQFAQKLLDKNHPNNLRETSEELFPIPDDPSVAEDEDDVAVAGQVG